MVDKYINGESSAFVSGDLFGVALHFHAGNLAPAPAQTTQLRGRGQGFRRRGRQAGWYDADREREREKDQHQFPSLEGFPENVCYGYNYRTCAGKCSKSHVCRLCRAPHKASQCTSKK